MANESSGSGGIGVLSLLGFLFVAFKLLGIIHWSWWWVTLPFWGGIAFLGVLLIILTVIAVIAAALE